MQPDAHSLTFAYLVADQRPADVVSFPDGTEELHAPGQGVAAAASWTQPHSVTREQDDPVGADQPSTGEALDAHAVQSKLEELVAAWEAATRTALAEIERNSPSFGNPQAGRASY